MGNADTAAAWTYHNRYEAFAAECQRRPAYVGVVEPAASLQALRGPGALSLPQELAHSSMPALAAIVADGKPGGKQRPPDLETLAAVLHFSAGITKALQVQGGSMAFRAAACTGALYHIEDVYRVRRSSGVGGWRLSLRRPRQGTAQAPQRRLPWLSGRRRWRRDVGARRAGGHRFHQHFLAQRLEVPGPARIGTASGTAGPFWPTCWQWRRPTAFMRESSGIRR